MPTEEQIMEIKSHSKKGRIAVVELEYPEELHDSHNSYPLAPEKKVVTQMSEYQIRLRADVNIDPPNSEKLVLTPEDKGNTWSTTDTCSSISGS